MMVSKAPNSEKRQKVGVALQYVYPKRLLSRLMYHATRIAFGPWKNWQIRWFTRRYGVDVSEAEASEPAAYEHFNAFFTRALKPGARPMPDNDSVAVSPADGVLYEFGAVSDGTLIQAKSHRYPLSELLGDAGEAEGKFDNGRFYTVYLAPGDYHRVHMPFGGRLKEMVYVPGSLFSVNPVTARQVPRLFARNERMVARFDTRAGRMAVVMVGAVFVGAIETVWHGQVTPAAERTLTRWRYEPPVNVPVLDRGQEMGRFNMGSTVIVVTESADASFAHGLKPGTRVKVGHPLMRFSALASAQAAGASEGADQPGSA